MSYFEANMPLINLGAYSAPLDLLAGFKGPILLRERRRGRMGGKVKGGEKKGRKGRG